ncbi:MAG: type I-E CRISPR-associated protein Cse1/CasA, partial [Ruminococcaceae bacterium]|nr:type I-E CRISPR-associated protein Cse1/CasA [Oscillospiraceae bacterium]
MKASFSVLDQAWIPVVSLDGEEKFLGIRQVLEHAHELREISSASPLEEYSVYRFLGLFLMDALRPETELHIEDLLDAGRFDMKQVEAYIALCESEGVSF